MIRKNKLFKFLDFCLAFLFSPFTLFYRIFPKRAKKEIVPHNILISKLCCFGDSLLALISIRALKEKYPKASITVLASQRNAAIFKRTVYIDYVIMLPISGIKGIGEILRIFDLFPCLLKLIQAKYNVFLDYDLYYRFTTLLGIFCGWDFSAGFETFTGRTRFYHYGAVRPRDEKEWRCFFNILKPLHVLPETCEEKLTFRLVPLEIEKAKQVAPDMPGRINIGIVPGASLNWPEKRWPLKSMAELLDKLNTAIKARFFLFGIKEELILTEEMLKLYGRNNIVNLVGKTNFPEIAAVVGQMDLFISNDTGPMHLAALLGVPTVGIFGPTNEKKWSPPGVFKAVLSDCPCRPCYYLSSMPDCKDFICLGTLSSDTVYQAAMEMLEQKKS
jgi:ADP-heptose:LPS heptosyltransferase